MRNTPNVAFAYLYRDGGNNKRSREAVFANPDGMNLDEADRRLRAAFRDGQYFIPERIGLESAAGDWTHDDELDHPWNEYFAGDLDATASRPTDSRALRAFVEQVEAVAADGWEEAERMRKRAPVQITRCVNVPQAVDEVLRQVSEEAIAELVIGYESGDERDFWADHEMDVEVINRRLVVRLTCASNCAGHDPLDRYGEDELRRRLRDIRDILWPPDNPDEPWDSDTIAYVAHLVPKREEANDGRSEET